MSYQQPLSSWLAATLFSCVLSSLSTLYLAYTTHPHACNHYLPDITAIVLHTHLFHHLFEVVSFGFNTSTVTLLRLESLPICVVSLVMSEL